MPPEKFRGRMEAKDPADVKISPDLPANVLGKNIAILLREPKERLLVFIVENIGKELAIKLYNQTQDIGTCFC